MRNSLQLLESLHLTDRVAVAELTSRQRAYDCVHLGTQPLKIGKLLALLQDEPALKPPRTGHLGNWDEIALGRSGAMDFNQAICTHGFGYPLIYCFTQTEASNPETNQATGDWVYLPGSTIQQDQRQVLPLYTWDGSSYVRRSRDRALFCPFVQTEVNGSLIPLTTLHWQRMQGISGFEFGLEASAIISHTDEVKSMLGLLLEEASQRENSRRAFQDLISHAVAKDGTMTRCEIRREGKGYWLDHYYYPSTEALVESALIPFQSVTDPQQFFENIAALPPLLPVVSHFLVGIFSAIFATHYPNATPGEPPVTRPFNTHFHWGARDMAGYPPLRKGYFVEKSTTRSLRSICTALVSTFSNVDPVCILLLPASIFMLYPSNAYPQDAECLAGLFEQIHQAVVDPDNLPIDRMQQTIETLTHNWLSHHPQKLSSYFLNRFSPRTGVLHGRDRPTQSIPQEPDGFRELTFQQACMIVGAMHTFMQAEVAV
jgi:Family of unknown function (DUF6025)